MKPHRLLLAILATLLALNAGGQQVTVDNLQYLLDTPNQGEASITGHQEGKAFAGTISIPPTVKYDGNTYRVTSISHSAFNGYEKLTGVTISDEIVSIGQNAFSGSALTQVRIPFFVRHMGRGAFYNCPALAKVEMGTTWVDSWEGEVFSQSSSLTELTLPEGVTTLENDFYNCRKLSRIELPGSLTKIGSHTFEESGLTSVDIPASVTEIAQAAFHNCNRLTQITLREGLTTIGRQAFGFTTITSVNIPTTVTSLDIQAFDCSTLKEVALPPHITEIPELCFGSAPLTALTIPAKVTSIGRLAFGFGITATSIDVLAPNPPALGERAFAKGVKTIRVPAGKKSAYQNAPGWKNFTIEEIPAVNTLSASIAPTPIEVGKTAPLSITIKPATASKNVFISAKPEGLVQISNPGSTRMATVTGLKGGKVTITVTSMTDPAKTYQLTLHVIYAPVTGVNVHGNYDVTLSQQAQYTTKVTPENANPAVTWSVDPTTLATISPTGLLTPKAVGRGSVKATSTADPKRYGTFPVNIRYDDPTSLEITGLPAELPKGSSITLKANVLPATADQTVTWSVQPTTLATIEKGNRNTLKALEVGEITITATSKADPTKSATKTLSINYAAIQSIAIEGETSPLPLGTTRQFRAIILPTNASQEVEWSVEPNDLATINSTGMLTARKAGEVKVIATSKQDNKFQGTLNFQIVNITLTGETTPLPLSGTRKFSATIQPPEADQSITWSVSPKERADISSEGLLTPKAIGEVSITATSTTATNISKSLSFEITYDPANTVDITGLPTELPKGGTLTLAANVLPATADQTVTWSVEPSSLAKIEGGNILKALEVGEITITATSKADPTKSATKTLSINYAAIQSIAIEGETSTLPLGTTRQFRALILPTNASQEVEWSVEPNDLATINSTGMLTARKAGEVKVIATSKQDNKYQGTLNFQIVTPNVQDITLTGETTPLPLSGTRKFSATIQPPEADQTITWSVSPKERADISSEGLLTPKAIGEVSITATSATATNISKSLSFEITYDPANTVDITGLPSELPKGGTLTLAANVLPATADQTVTWSVEPTTLAKIEDGNILKALEVGEVSITATSKADPTKSDTKTLSINYAAIQSIAIEGETSTLPLGTTRQFRALILPTNANPAVTWKTVPKETASIDENGLLTPKASGEVTIIATSVANATMQAELKIDISPATTVASNELPWRVGINGRTLIIYGAEGQTLELYNLASTKLLRVSPVTLEPYMLTVPQPGVYVVRVGNGSRKVVVQ